MLRRSLLGLGTYAWVSLTANQVSAQECRATPDATASTNETAEAVGSSKGITIDFDHFATGHTPEGFVQILTGKGKTVDWAIRPEPTAPSSPNVLAQISTEEESFRFPLLVYNKFTAKNVEVTVHFKPISGKIDQAAGVIVRYQDEKHFYVALASALENEVKLYKVVGDIHQPISGASAIVTSGKWHELQLSVQGSHFHICFDGIPLFEAEDDTYQQAGKVGLSTKSDGVIAFDDLHILGGKDQ
jgi:hypothetical protein